MKILFPQPLVAVERFSTQLKTLVPLFTRAYVDYENIVTLSVRSHALNCDIHRYESWASCNLNTTLSLVPMT